MRSLIFVYNANSGALNTALDIAHKLISPSTYQCNLCSLTHGVFSEHEDWKHFREESDDELIFLHKDEFEKAYNHQQDDYPVVFEKTSDGLNIFISANDMRTLNDLPALMAQLRSR